MKLAELDETISELEKQLSAKKLEREQLQTIKQSCDGEISKAKGLFKNQLYVLEQQLKKIKKAEEANVDDQKKFDIDSNDLKSYQQSYAECINDFNKELSDIEDFESRVRKQVVLIDSTLLEKEQSKERANYMKQQLVQMKGQKESDAQTKEFLSLKVSKYDA